VGHPAQPSAQAGSPRAGCTAPRPGRAGISPEKETPQPPWAACCLCLLCNRSSGTRGKMSPLCRRLCLPRTPRGRTSFGGGVQLSLFLTRDWQKQHSNKVGQLPNRPVQRHPKGAAAVPKARAELPAPGWGGSCPPGTACSPRSRLCPRPASPDQGPAGQLATPGCSGLVREPGDHLAIRFYGSELLSSPRAAAEPAGTLPRSWLRVGTAEARLGFGAVSRRQQTAGGT